MRPITLKENLIKGLENIKKLSEKMLNFGDYDPHKTNEINRIAKELLKALTKK